MTPQQGVTWTGLEELGQTLRALPQQFQVEAGRVIAQAAHDHLRTMQREFPENDGPPRRRANGTVRQGGTLRRSTVLEQRDPMKYVVRNKAPHAHLYEWGYTHVSGKQVKGKRVFVTAAVEIRARMLLHLQALLVQVATRTGLLRAA
jgi:hypothetical protein